MAGPAQWIRAYARRGLVQRSRTGGRCLPLCLSTEGERWGAGCRRDREKHGKELVLRITGLGGPQICHLQAGHSGEPRA